MEESAYYEILRRASIISGTSMEWFRKGLERLANEGINWANEGINWDALNKALERLERGDNALEDPQQDAGRDV